MAVDQVGHLLSDSTVVTFPPAELIFGLQGPEEAKNLAGKSPPPDSDLLNDTESRKNLACLSSKLAVSTNL